MVTGVFILEKIIRKKLKLLEKLTKSELINIIGTELYRDISSFLENVLDEDEGLKVYQKHNIIRLLLSLSENKTLRSPKFWKDVSSRLTKEETNSLISSGVNFDAKARDFADSCLIREYKKYSIETVEEEETLVARKAITRCDAPNRTFKFLKDYNLALIRKLWKH